MEIISSDIDVFVGNKTCIDKSAYALWLKHVEAKDASKQLGLKHKDIELDYLFAYTLDQFRIFCMLEPMLQHPQKLFHQLLFQFSTDVKKALLYKYYEIDEAIIRQIIGKKLSKGTRRDLDEVSAKTLKPLKVCQRQFDNCRRIFKVVEDVPFNIADEVEKKFHLSPDLSRRYAAVVFLSSYRFECNKRKLSHLDLDDFIQCFHLFTASWTVKHDGSIGAELDADFLHDLRSIKIVSNDINKLYRSFNQLASKETEEIRRRLCSNDSTVKMLMKNIVSIGSNMYKPKAVREFFIDVIEKVCDLGKALGWRVDHFQKFFDLYQTAIGSARQSHNSIHTWKRYLKTFSKCSLQLYRF